MSSANNHKRHSLENEFQRRMFDAEASPAPDLWARIDHELTVQENQDYRKRVLFYRQLAAACFVLFALTGALLAYHFNNGVHEASQPTMAALPQSGKATAKDVTPEEAMKAYLQQQASTSVAALEPASDATAPEVKPKPNVERKQMAPALAGIKLAPEEAQKGSYYNVAPGYSPYLGFGQETGRNKGLVSGYAPGNSQASFGNLGFPSGNRYSQIITWESVTITFGNNPAVGQPAPANRSLAVKPNTLADVNGSQSLLRQNQAKQQAEVLAATLNKDQEKAAQQQQKNDGRWSLNLAYAPSYFEQNIGLTDMTRLSSGSSRFSLTTADNDYVPVNASQESYKNLTAAREEYRNNTEPAFSYAVEVKAGVKLKEKLKLLTGIGYSESVSRTRSNFIVRQFWVKPRTNERYDMGPSTIFMSALSTGLVSDSISVTPTSEAFATDYKYKHLSIPVGLQYEHDIAKDWFVYVAGGLAANFLLETTVTASHQDVQPVTYSQGDEGSPFRNVQLSSNASLGVGKRISPNLTVALGPEIRNYFNTLVADPENMTAPQGRPYALGLTMGLNYQLNNGRR